MKIKFAVTVLLILILLNIPASSQVTRQWVNNFGISGSDYQRKTLVDKFTGDIYVLSNNLYGNNFIRLVKYGFNGRQLWVKTYSVSEHNCYAFDMTLDNLGGIIITGNITYKENSFQSDYLTVKYSSDGQLMWTRKYNGPQNFEDISYKVITDGNGGAIVTGKSFNSGSNYDIVTVKYSFDGTLEWSKRYSTDWNYKDVPNALAIDGNGCIYITGFTGNTYNTYDRLLIKYSRQGDLEWSRKDTLRGEQQGLQVINNGTLDEIYILSMNYYQTSYLGDVIVDCLDRQGNSKWSAAFPNAFEPGAILDENENRVYLYGCKDTVGCILRALNLNMQGRLTWSETYTAGISVVFTAGIALDNFHNIYLVSNCDNEGAGSDIFTTKFNSNGDELWVTRFNNSGSGFDRPQSICLDNDNNIIITGGCAPNLPETGVIVTVKYSQGILPRFSSEIPSSFKLHQNYPNPFNPSTQIKYDLPYDADVKITVYDMLGKELAVLVNEQKTAGNYEVNFDASQLSSGMYFYKFEAGSYSETKKMLFVK